MIKCRTIRLVEPELCSVPGCLVRTFVPNEYGMCSVWDFKHDDFYDAASRRDRVAS